MGPTSRVGPTQPVRDLSMKGTVMADYYRVEQSGDGFQVIDSATDKPVLDSPTSEGEARSVFRQLESTAVANDS